MEQECSGNGGRSGEGKEYGVSGLGTGHQELGEEAGLVGLLSFLCRGIADPVSLFSWNVGLVAPTLLCREA